MCDLLMTILLAPLAWSGIPLPICEPIPPAPAEAVVEVPPEPEVGTSPTEPEPTEEPEPERTKWDELADCESGNWLGATTFEEGSARWHVAGTDERAQPHPPWSNGLFYGGLQFTKESWAWAAEVGGHDVGTNPANHSRERQIEVAETLLDLQGWVAWPTCSERLGWR